MSVREVDGLMIRDSVFLDGTVFGVHFSNAGLKTDVDIWFNEFREFGANAILAVHVDGLWIRNNDFIDNHNDRQWHVCGPNGDSPCSGGQFLINSRSGAPTSDVLVSGNLLDITYPDGSANLQSATGLEISPRSDSTMFDVRVLYNRIHNHGRQGIQVHNVAGNNGTPGQPDFLELRVEENTLSNNRRFFGSSDIARYITLNNNTHVDIDTNRIAQTKPDWTTGSFLDTPDSCDLAGQSSCTINVHWRLENIPAGSTPEVRVNGTLFSQGATSGGRRELGEDPNG